MHKLFSKPWMAELKKLWNNDEHVIHPLEEAQFHSIIGYGFKDEEHPRGVMMIDNGRVVGAGEYTEQPLDWDLRADIDSWQDWLENGFGITRIGPAVATGSLKFKQGNYRQMIRNPKLGQPFLHHFTLMGKIPTVFES